MKPRSRKSNPRPKVEGECFYGQLRRLGWLNLDIVTVAVDLLYWSKDVALSLKYADLKVGVPSLQKPFHVDLPVVLLSQ